MRIVHVTTERGFGGGEVQVLLLLEGLRARGVELVLVAPKHSRIGAEARARGLPVRDLALATPFDLHSTLVLARLLEGCDLAHLHTGRAAWLGQFAARWAKRPWIVARRTMRAVRRGPRSRLIYGHGCRAVVAVSQAIATGLANAGVGGAKIVRIPDAVDPARVLPRRGRAATRAGLDIGETDVLVLALAKLAPGKGLDVLLRAVAQARRDVPELVLALAGAGPEAAHLRALAAELGLGTSVRFLGRRDDVGDLLAACDLFAMPSRHEGFGTAAIEALAAGRPVVASRVGGLVELLEDGAAGVLVPPDDVEALRAAITRVASDRELARRLAERGPARVAAGLLPQHMVEAHLRLYTDVLAARA